MSARFTVSVDVRLFDPQVTRLLADKTNECARRAAEKTQQRARNYAPSRTGELRRSIIIRGRQGRDMATYTVGSPLKYAKWQNDGTGPIHARPGGVLVFSPKGGGGPIFRRSTRGVPATRFMNKAFDQITLADFLP